MSAEYEIVRYRPEHKAMVAELQKELWSSDHQLNKRYLEWKYERTPDRRGSFIYLALHEGRPVGMRGFHEVTLEAGTPAQTMPALAAGDALVSTAHRNRGLVPRIMKLAEADLAHSGYAWLLSLGGASRINTLGLLALGWRSAGGVQPAGRVTARAQADRRLRRVFARLPVLWKFSEARILASADQQDPFRHLDAALAGSGPGTGLPIAVERSPRPDAMAGLVERVGHDGRIRYCRDGAYLAWRFRNPTSEYRFLYWEESGLEGYLVLGRRTSDLGAWDRVYISDVEATSMKIRSELLSAAIRLGRFPELVTWTASLSEPENHLLESRGFTPVDLADRARGCPGILLRPVRNDVPQAEWVLGTRNLLDIRNWDIRVLYSMRG